MPISFSSSELVNIAIGIERSGIAFYDILARSADNDTSREIYQNLADMERQHIKVFEGMLPDVDQYKIPEIFADEYDDYLKVLVKNAVFTDDLIAGEMAMQADDDIKAMELAIYAEKDSILFYSELINIMPEKVQPTINKIIDEEKSHLFELSALKEKLAEG